MSATYDGTILDHLAGHILYLSTASLFWFSLSLSHDHGFHLSQRLGITPHDYKCHLVAANLAHFHGCGGGGGGGGGKDEDGDGKGKGSSGKWQ
jgi:hypothetical protein